MKAIDDDLRARLLDGLPPRVQGMAEAIIVEWESAVSAVPELERLAAEDVVALVALRAEEREDALRRRWQRLHDVPRFELTGRPQRHSGTGRTAAAR
ncbi:MAG TPA: hypothetical protein VN193_12750 [Candidatus Angelobacter sp.]|jgi:hypothetical protein|nr:hypothetical protein [Candidatus Angelobacter sp.]